jgi:hypothetical protein
MKYTVISRRYYENPGPNGTVVCGWSIKLSGELPSPVAQISVEELDIVRSKEDGDKLCIGSELILELATRVVN